MVSSFAASTSLVRVRLGSGAPPGTVPAGSGSSRKRAHLCRIQLKLKKSVVRPAIAGPSLGLCGRSVAENDCGSDRMSRLGYGLFSCCESGLAIDGRSSSAMVFGAVGTKRGTQWCLRIQITE